jgi:protein O-mannosyl-transferase
LWEGLYAPTCSHKLSRHKAAPTESIEAGANRADTGPSVVLDFSVSAFQVFSVLLRPLPRSSLLLGALLLALTFLAYWPALTGALLWDDDAHITRAALQSLHGLRQIWFEAGATQQYYPVLHSAFWLEHRLWGDHVLGYHLVNVLLHATSALLLVAILRRLAIRGAWLAGFIFALHPIGTESVAWIAEQKNTLSTALYLAALLAYLGFAAGSSAVLQPAPQNAVADGRGLKHRATFAYALASAFFLLALLTKSVTATLPAALLVILWWRNGRLNLRRDIVPLTPWFAIAIPIGLFTSWVERHYIGAEGSDFALAAVQRLLLAGNAIAFYLAKLVWPTDLSFIYPRWTIDASVWWWYIAPIGLLVLTAGAIAFARRNRGPLAALLLFVGTLFPVLGFVNVYPFVFSYVANHFAYLAAMPLIALLCATLQKFRMPTGQSFCTSARPTFRNFSVSAFQLFSVSLLTLLTWREAHTYRDPITLYRTTLDRNPDAWLAHYNLAVLEEKEPKLLADAIAHYEATLRLRPNHWAAHNNLGSALLQSAAPLPRAIAEFETAIRLQPDFAEAHNNLGIALTHLPDRSADAIAHFRIALKIRPDYVEARVNLANVLASQPNGLADAISEYQAALRTHPNDAEAHFNLGNALLRSPGRSADAIAEYQTAIRLRPDYRQAHNNLGAALARTPGRLADAIEEYRTALRIDPNDPQAHVNLANALLRQPGHNAAAASEYEAAIRLSPNDAALHCSLGIALSDIRERWSDARAEFERALQLRPDFVEAHYCLAVVLLRQSGDRALAATHLDAALRLKPDFEAARKLRARLGAE